MECNVSAHPICPNRAKDQCLAGEYDMCGFAIGKCRQAGVPDKDGTPTECRHIDGIVCKVYINPSRRWNSLGGCPLSHQNVASEVARKVNPLKASKKAAKTKQ